MTSYVITTNIDEQFPNFGASGAFVYGLLTWLLLAVLFRRNPTSTRRRSMNVDRAAGVWLD